jgi:hypothetical protein
MKDVIILLDTLIKTEMNGTYLTSAGPVDMPVWLLPFCFL